MIAIFSFAVVPRDYQFTTLNILNQSGHFWITWLIYSSVILETKERISIDYGTNG